MQIPRNRLMAVSGTALALVIASTAAVAAAGPRDRDRLPGTWGKGRIEWRMDDLGVMRARLGETLDEFGRREVTTITADGTSVTRVDHGTVDVVGDASLDYTLVTGQGASVTIDEDTDVIGYSEQTVTRRGWSRERLVPTEMELADVAAGAEIVVWSDSDDGETFVARRVVIQPVDEAEATEEAAEAEAAEEPVEDATAETETSPIQDEAASLDA